LSDFPDQERLRRGWSATVDEFERLIADLRQYLGSTLAPQIELRPGTMFGPLNCRGSGRRCGDFAYVLTETTLVTTDCFERLKGAGIRGLVPVEANLTVKARTSARPRLLELHVEPRAHLSKSCVERWDPRCTRCGLGGPRAVRRPLSIVSSSLPSEVDLFRIHEWNTFVLVSDAFRAAVEALQLTNVKFHEVVLE
jgi:uncharacterized double-CXXCG motif protein